MNTKLATKCLLVFSVISANYAHALTTEEAMQLANSSQDEASVAALKQTEERRKLEDEFGELSYQVKIAAQKVAQDQRNQTIAFAISGTAAVVAGFLFTVKPTGSEVGAKYMVNYFYGSVAVAGSLAAGGLGLAKSYVISVDSQKLAAFNQRLEQVRQQLHDLNNSK